jgi:hypothetical protein
VRTGRSHCGKLDKEVEASAWETSHQWRQAVSHQSIASEGKQSATSQLPVKASSQPPITSEGQQSATNHQSRYQQHCAVQPVRPIKTINTVQYVTAAKLIATDILVVRKTRQQVGNVEGGTIHVLFDVLLRLSSASTVLSCATRQRANETSEASGC